MFIHKTKKEQEGTFICSIKLCC